MIYSLEGQWQADIGDGRTYPMSLPGTLDGNRIGTRDEGKNQWHQESALGREQEGFREKVILTRLTRNYTFEGEARLTCQVTCHVPQGRIFLEAERARCLRLLVDGQEIPHFRRPTLCTPHVFEVTGCWKGSHELTLLSDNSYPGMPHDDIVYSSAATDETQTNWNGVLGYLRLRVENEVFVDGVKVYPSKDRLTVKVSISGSRPWKGRISVRSKALKALGGEEAALREGITEVVLADLPLAEGALRWDEYQGNLHELTVVLAETEDHLPLSEKTVSFGIRDFGGDKRGRLALNGRTIFLRSEANCGVFPETGYCPMKVDEWMEILKIYQSYGVNCMRFHSHCPPEAAFFAADKLGMLMQPELSHWNPRDAFESEESFSYYRTELEEIIGMLANHPSFVMLTFGNELHASEKGHSRMKELLAVAHKLDATRLYANGSNVHYGAKGCDPDSDFYTSFNYYQQELRGTFDGMKGYINHSYPNAMRDFHQTMDSLRENYKKPVFSFEVGQFEVLPDFGELADFQGVTIPDNLRYIKKKVEEKGLAPQWKRYVEATGELAKICYREEIEAAMRTKELSGISLLGLQDFPGQGTALVGMLNSHLNPKPYDFARPEAFRAFFASCLPLVLLPKYTYENSETLLAKVRVANFGKDALAGELCYRLRGEGVSREGKKELVCCPAGTLTDAGELEIPLGFVEKNTRLNLTVWVGEISNSYPVWVYLPVTPVCPESVYETEHLDEGAKKALEEGKTVYLTPPSTKEALPVSIQAQFSTDFWSVGTFPSQEGAMGQLIDEKHPIFREFPTEFHTNWQWWAMASQRAVILPKQYRAIVTEMDSYAYLRPMAQLLECRCQKGKLLFSTMGLQNLQKYPEARALLASFYRYLDSEEFRPGQEMEWEELTGLVKLSGG